MIGSAAFEELFDSLGTIYSWASTTTIINAGGFSLSWFELWISFTAITGIFDILLVPFLKLRNTINSDSD